MEQGWREWQLSSGPAWSHHPSLSARGVGTWGSFPMPCEDCSGALVLSQVAMNDLSPAGPIQAVEILMESPSLAHTCRMHHAVIRRMQVWSHGAHPRVTPRPRWTLRDGFSGTVVWQPYLAQPGATQG